MSKTDLCENTESRTQHAKLMSTPKGGGDRKLSLIGTIGKTTNRMHRFRGHLQQGACYRWESPASRRGDRVKAKEVC